MAKLHLPCLLGFSTRVKVGQHVFLEDDDCRPYGCIIRVNPEVDFRVPEHLILHEAAHHRASAQDEYHGHDEVWARVLCQIYEETGVALPYSTGFEQFALAAGIKHKVFDEVGKGTIVEEG
jgi:hypothetical protein